MGRRGDTETRRLQTSRRAHVTRRTTFEKETPMETIRSYKQLRVYQAAIDAAMRIFEITKSFPAKERFSMVDQMRRSSRSVCANIGEAWRKRRYAAPFVSKLSDSESEAEETRVWLDLAFRCKYISQVTAAELDEIYDHIRGQLVRMMEHPEHWTLKTRKIQKMSRV